MFEHSGFFLVAVCTAARVSLKWMREPVFFCRSAWNCCYGGRQRRHRRRETSLVYNPPVCVDYLLRIPLWHRSHVCVHDVRLQTKRSANTNSCSPWDHTGRLDPADVFNVYLFCMFILHLKRSRTRNSSVSAFVKTFLRSCRYITRSRLKTLKHVTPELNSVLIQRAQINQLSLVSSK